MNITIHLCGSPEESLEAQYGRQLGEMQEAEHELRADLACEEALASAKLCPWCEAPLYISCECRERNPPAIEVADVELVDIVFCTW